MLILTVNRENDQRRNIVEVIKVTNFVFLGGLGFDGSVPYYFFIVHMRRIVT